jgi:SsrA-binding protein
MKKVIATNKRAKRDYDIEEEYDAGVVLKGAEVKSVRAGNISISDAYATVEDEEVFLYNMHIGKYKPASHEDHDPKRKRKLLLKTQEIKKLSTRVIERGYTLVPLKIYINSRGFVKIILNLGKGKRKFDKREDIKKREHDRDIDKHK